MREGEGEKGREKIRESKKVKDGEKTSRGREGRARGRERKKKGVKRGRQKREWNGFCLFVWFLNVLVNY